MWEDMKLKKAAERVLAAIQRPTGKIHEMKLPDTEETRAALLALSDALGRGIP